ncbi:MAG: heavy metal-responsive transcriptional regulator [Phycisphaerales bacterium]|jgi:MerR family mercuric resistance operon transcriptional regulator|nr:heavy metal-responsive transcriptional regulator [Phycisphaerales bacterium]
MSHYTIGQLARAAGVPTSTVRYYERRRLLQPEARSGGNYRVYDEDALERLRFIRSSQAAGFTLADIGALLRFRDGNAAPCQEVQDLIKTRLDRVHEELEHLSKVEALLRNWMRVCKAAQRTGRCGVLEGLSTQETGCCRNPRDPA